MNTPVKVLKAKNPKAVVQGDQWVVIRFDGDERRLVESHRTAGQAARAAHILREHARATQYAGTYEGRHIDTVEVQS